MWALGLVGMLLLGCEREPAPEQRVVADFMTAWTYGDWARMFALHEEGGPGGSWCGSAEFVRSLERAKGLRDEARCAEARVVTDGEAGEVGEEAMLLAAQLRLVCEDAQAGCREWSWRVFEAAGAGCALRPGSFVVQQVQRSGDRAVAYVDVVDAAGAPVKRKVEVARSGQVWQVVTPLEELCGA